MNQPNARISQEVIEVMSDTLGLSGGSVTLNSSLRDELKADSLDMVEIQMTLEDRFDVMILDSHVEGFKTVGDVVGYLEWKTGGRR